MVKQMIQNKNAVLFTLGCVANDPQLLKIYKLNDNDFVEKWYKATYMGIQILADKGVNEIFVDDLEEALKHLRTMRDTWKEVMKIAGSQAG